MDTSNKTADTLTRADMLATLRAIKDAPSPEWAYIQTCFALAKLERQSTTNRSN